MSDESMNRAVRSLGSLLLLFSSLSPSLSRVLPLRRQRMGYSHPHRYVASVVSLELICTLVYRVHIARLVSSRFRVASWAPTRGDLGILMGAPLRWQVRGHP